MEEEYDEEGEGADEAFNLVFLSDSAIIACLTASLMGRVIVSPVNFLQSIIYNFNFFEPFVCK
jgi:hypothetical protein